MAWNIAPPEGQLGWRVPISVPALTPLTEMHAVAGILPAGLQLIVPIRSPLMTSVAAMLTPTVGLSLPPIVAPLLHATAAMPTPSVASGFVMIPPAMAAVAQVPTPALSVSQALTAPVLHATAAIPTPTVSVTSGINIPAPMLQATAAILTPVVSVSGAITASLLQATAAMPAPSLLVGTGVNINVPPPTQIVADNFVRANSTTSAGPNWTNQAGVIGISGNTAYPVGAPGGWNVASYNAATMSTDDMDASVTLGTFSGTTDAGLIHIGCNAAGEGVFAEWDNQGVSIATQTSWTLGGYVQQVGIGYAYTAGDVLGIRRRGNVYTVMKNGVSTGCTWTDSGNLVPIDANHRYVGFGLLNDSSAGPRHVIAFQASNVPTAGIVATAALLPPTVTVTAPPVGVPQVISTAIKRAATR